MVQQRMGGSFAPPLTAEKLAAYRALGAACDDPQCAGYIKDLADMVELFWQTPASTLPSEPHSSGLGKIIPLEEAEIKRIWDAVPWREECNVMSDCFAKLQGDVRNAAYHLVWFARELTIDREPITTDKL